MSHWRSAIYAYGKANLTIESSFFIDNTASYGGAIMDREGNQLSCNRCLVEYNFAEIDGGAIYADYGTHEKWTDSYFLDNQAKHCGGVFYVISRASQLEATKIEVTNSVFSGNTVPLPANLMNLNNSDVYFGANKLAESSTVGVVGSI